MAQQTLLSRASNEKFARHSVVVVRGVQSMGRFPFSSEVAFIRMALFIVEVKLALWRVPITSTMCAVESDVFPCASLAEPVHGH